MKVVGKGISIGDKLFDIVYLLHLKYNYCIEDTAAQVLYEGLMGTLV